MNPVWLIAVPLSLAFLGIFSGNISRILLWIAAISNSIISIKIATISGTTSFVIGGWKPPFGINLVVDDGTKLIVVAVNIIFLLALLATSTEKLKSSLKLSVVYMLSLAALNGIVLTGDLFNLFVFLEIASISAYIIAASSQRNESKFAAFKYLIIGSVGSALYLLGTSMLYATYGTLNMADISQHMKTGMIHPNVLTVVSLLYLFGLGVEAKLFPLNGWVPDVYSYASQRATTILATAFPVVMIFAFSRIFVTVIGFGEVQSLIIILGLLTVVIGEVIAFSQKKLKRMLAYSSIAQAGLALLLIGIGTESSMTGAFMLLINNSISKLILFSIAGYIISTISDDSFEKVAAFASKSRISALLFTAGALSVIGMPLFFGFRAKLLIIESTISYNLWVPVVFLVTALIEAVYYFTWIFNIYRPDTADSIHKKLPVRTLIAGSILVVMIIILGIASQGAFEVFEKAGTAILDSLSYASTVLLGGI